eukprot:CAMPEP_0119098630 /NCGR_PEP_ID=MMETSP1178-20130426/184685_1 /TAXON_ID=33656 /ORGANISM="unid sp, Strain CCMP2000" /LENGTH=57 /DNA_ID=CAMNT_0007082609 /DNA_START=644 /DNA_END=813 /DNA_ORIENTATION=-
MADNLASETKAPRGSGGAGRTGPFARMSMTGNTLSGRPSIAEKVGMHRKKTVGEARR